MGNKFVKIVVINILVTLIVGLTLSPLSGWLQSIIDGNQIMYLFIKLVISILALIISLFIAVNFVTLAAGESRKIAFAITVVNFVFGVWGIISNSLVTSQLNSLSGQNIQVMPIYLSALYVLIGSALVYSFTEIILTRYESNRIKSS